MNSAEFQTISYVRQGAVANITLNRPHKLNAVDAAMMRELHLALDLAESDQDVRVIVLCGAGKAFSAGFDLSEGGDVPAEDVDFWRAELQRGFDIIMRFWDCPKPTVAAVHRYCLGSGMEMALACDITIAAQGTRFGAPEVKFGSGMVAMILPWLIGVKPAKELLLTGDDEVSAERALALGMVNQVVPGDQLADAANAMALRLARNDTLAVRLTKQAINRSMDIMGMREALVEALAVDVEIETTETSDSKTFNKIYAQEGLQAALAWRESGEENQ